MDECVYITDRWKNSPVFHLFDQLNKDCHSPEVVLHRPRTFTFGDNDLVKKKDLKQKSLYINLVHTSKCQK